MTTNKTIPIYQQIDLDRHAVVEASAGTGKTYTIEHLVLRILLEKGLPIDQLLLVTFTEKAAEELRARVRKLLEEEVEKEEHSPEKKLFLESNLTQIENAHIQTIHAFCKSQIDRYPFETKGVLEEFPKEAYDHVELVWREMLDANHPAIDAVHRLYRASEASATLQDWFKKFFLKVPEIVKEYNPQTDEIALPADDFLLRPSRAELEQAGKLGEEQKLKEAYSLIPKICKALRELIELAHQLYIERMERVGEVTFDEMIRLLRRGIEQPGSALLSHLQQRFRYGIIDEFQDTNSDQWAIFKKIFLDDAEGVPDRRMIVVGDPKQSIYKFQGADVRAYLLAREKIELQGGRIYTLGENFRSHQQLIDDANLLFSQEDWFLKRTSQIGLGEPVAAGHAEASQEFSGYSGLYPISASDKNLFSQSVAKTIQKLHGQLKFDPKKREENGRLDYSDFAILAPSHSALLPLMKQLEIAQIPYVKYKERGIYTTEEALHWLLLLEAIDRDPQEDRPLLKTLPTYFFGLSIEEMGRSGRDRDPRAIWPLFDRWRELAAQQRWSELFFDIWKSTELERRLLNEPQIDGEAILSRLSQLADYTAEWLEGNSATLREVILHLRALYRKKIELADDQDLHQKSSEKSAVQLMTIHASKGLEFPVVFVETRKKPITATKAPYAIEMIEGEREGKSRRINFVPVRVESTGIKIEKDLSKRQDEEEERRLFYVAITRASQLCFPHYWKQEEGERENFFAPAVKSYLEWKKREAIEISDEGQERDRARRSQLSLVQFSVEKNELPDQDDELPDEEIQIVIDYAALFGEELQLFKKEIELYQKKEEGEEGSEGEEEWEDNVEEWEEWDELFDSSLERENWVDPYTGLFVSFNITERRPPPLPYYGRERAEHPLSKTERDWSRRWWRQTSYSALVHHRTGGGDDEVALDEAQIAPLRYADPYRALPRSSKTGNALHYLLEQADWHLLMELSDCAIETLQSEKVEEQQLLLLLKEALALQSLYGADLERELALIGRATLSSTVQLDGVAEPIQLGSLSPENRKAEVEFFFTFNSAGELFSESGEVAGFVRGFIDLLYLYRDDEGVERVGILDWKSNSLSDYSTPAALQEAMEKNGYEDQARLYTLALDRHLSKMMGEKYQAEKNLAPPLYVFMRGCKIGEGSSIWSPEKWREYSDIPTLKKRASQLLRSSLLWREVLERDDREV